MKAADRGQQPQRPQRLQRLQQHEKAEGLETQSCELARRALALRGEQMFGELPRITPRRTPDKLKQTLSQLQREISDVAGAVRQAQQAEGYDPPAYAHLELADIALTEARRVLRKPGAQWQAVELASNKVEEQVQALRGSAAHTAARACAEEAARAHRKELREQDLRTPAWFLMAELSDALANARSNGDTRR